jgi:predicted nucleic acid-binding protein
MIAYLRDEPGADTVEDALTNDEQPCVAHAVNVCEVYYRAVRRSDETKAASAIEDLVGMGLVVRDDLDADFWIAVGNYKASMPSVPLADCFVVALANRLDAEALTADHPDFDPIAKQGICRVTFIR